MTNDQKRLIDINSTETSSLVAMLTAVSHMRASKIPFGKHLQKILEFMSKMEDTGRKYFMSTIMEGQEGLHATMFKCDLPCKSSPTFN